MPEVHFTRRALFDIEAIDAYSIATWGKRVATEYLADLHAGAMRLREKPELLQERHESSLRVRFYPVRKHVLVCDLIGARIFVLAVCHAAMDLPERLAELEPQLVHEADLLAARVENERDDA